MKKNITLLRTVLLSLVLTVLLSSLSTTFISAEESTDKDSPSPTTSDTYGMSLITENSNYKLYADKKSGEFFVEDKADSYRWFSNPVDRKNDEYAKSDKTALSSQMILKVVNMKTLQEEYINNYICSVKENSVKFTQTEKGFKVEYNFKLEKITVSMIVTLNENSVDVSVPVDEIEEKDTRKILQLTLLPYFFAGSVNDEGYMVVPDGSGAVINFNNNKQGYVQYLEPVYGTDTVLSGNVANRKKENSCIPLFGIVSNNQALACVITEGDGASYIGAKVSKKGSGYNNANAIFNLRSSGTHTIGDYYGKEIKTYEKGNLKLKNCTVKYYFLKNEKANYTGIAKAYRGYLENDLKIKPLKNLQFSVFVELIGGVKKTKTVFGFPFKVVQPLTTFSQAIEIAEELKSIGVENIILDYQNWDKNVIMDKVSSKPSFSGKLGGKSGFNKLVKYTNDNNITLVTNVNVSTFTQSGNGISSQFDVAKVFTGIPGVKYGFKINTQQMDKSIPKIFYTAPAKTNSVFEKFMNGIKKLKVSNIGLDTMGKILYSDFSKNGYGRDDTKLLYQNLLKDASENNNIFVRTGNAYSLAYSDYIYDMPSEDSKNDMCDYSIPLYQIAMSGLKNYSIGDINHKTNPDKQLLKCMEYGSDIKFTWFYEEGSNVVQTSLSSLYAAHYTLWIDYLTEHYEKIKTVKSAINGAEITQHYRINENVYQTVYSNNKSIIVNYGDESFSLGDFSVSSLDYELIDRGDKIA